MGVKEFFKLCVPKEGETMLKAIRQAAGENNLVSADASMWLARGAKLKPSVEELLAVPLPSFLMCGTGGHTALETLLPK